MSRGTLPEPPPNFDRLAGVYRWMEALTFGPCLRRCRCAFLGEMKIARHALILGDGDGRFTAKLLQINRAVEIDAVDASPAMAEALLRRARKQIIPEASKLPLTDHLSNTSTGRDQRDKLSACLPQPETPAARNLRVRTHVADARCWRPPTGAQYDLVVTHFFLDCLTTEEVGALAVRIREAVAANALWVVSEFAIPPGRFGRLVARPLVALLYRVFGWMTGLRVRTLPHHACALERAGFARKKGQNLLRGLLTSQLWRLR